MENLEKVKPGFAMGVTTWENDGDNYKTEYIYGLTEQQMVALLCVFEMFGSKNNHQGPGFGNISSDDDFQRLEINEALTEEFSPALAEAIGFDYGTDREQILDVVWDFLYEMGVAGGEFYLTRVVESVKVYKITKFEYEAEHIVTAIP